MDLRELLQRHERRRGLLGVEKLTVIYAVFSASVAVVCQSEMPCLARMLAGRAAVLAGIAALAALYRYRACRLTFFLRTAFQISLLGYWYSDTYLFSQVFPNLDSIFAKAEQAMFGCQPSLLFSEKLGGIFWSEIFNLGYFSYYPMIFFAVLWTFFRQYTYFEKATFIIVCSFLIYSLIFMFLPVAGPQYYFQAAGLDNIRAGIFPDVGHYFRAHTEMLPKPQEGGLFQYLVELAQEGGEYPTAAFPSSHVGISTILLMLTYKTNSKAALLMLPFYALLCLSTVYIQAHYLIDMLAGLVSAFIIYAIACKLYDTRAFRGKRGVIPDARPPVRAMGKDS